MSVARGPQPKVESQMSQSSNPVAMHSKITSVIPVADEVPATMVTIKGKDDLFEKSGGALDDGTQDSQGASALRNAMKSMKQMRRQLLSGVPATLNRSSHND
jgi:hypothetical protein